MIHFISDTHFNHKNIIQYCNRPFSDVYEMNEYLIDRWNSKVNKGDTVYHNGDFGFGPKTDEGEWKTGVDRLRKIANRLKGKIILIRGNHDTNVNTIGERFETIKDIHVIHSHNTRFVLCHYPMRSWQFMNKGSVHLFGHCHGNMPPLYKSFDIGVDNIKKILGDYRPMNVKEIVEYANSLESPPWAI